jgi:RimJ/RimL family protein N-acetyltransferase
VTVGPAQLRDWSAADGGWYIAQLDDPEIQRFTTERLDTTLRDFREALDELGRRTDRAGFAIVDAATGELAGNLSASLHDGTVDLSYWIAPGYRHRGMASHALEQMCQWIRANWAARELALWTHADNVASQRVAEKAGFRHQPDRDQLQAVGEHTWPIRWFTRAP